MPGQSVLEQQVERLRRQFLSRLLILDAVLLEEVLGEERHVLPALAQRRQLHGNHMKAVEEVLPELPFFHHLAQLDVGRGDDPDVDLDRLDAAEPHELALLNDAQELGLRLERDVPNLVEENRALVGELEEPLLRIDRAGECALHVAEEVRLEQIRREVAGVDGDEGLVGAGRVLMQRSRDELLAGTALAVDQNRGAARRRLHDQIEDLLHPRASADDLAEPVGMRLQILPEDTILGDEAALGEGVPYDGQHFVVLERLGDVVEGAPLHRGDGALDRRERRDHQHRQLVVYFSQLVERGHPVHARHHDVDDGGIERHGAGELEAFGGISGEANGMPLARQQRFEDLAHDLLVVDDQNRAVAVHTPH